MLGNHSLRRFLTTLAILLAAIGPATASAGPSPGGPILRPNPKDPEMDVIHEARKAREAQQDSLKKIVDDRYREEKERKDREELKLRMDWSGIDKPPSPSAFKQAFHFPPVPQYSTGTCWAFSSVSYMESEVFRLTQQKVKLSEMWVVYWEYVEKARRFVREYGHSNFGEGSEEHAILDIYKKYGAVPAEAYRGVLDEKGLHDHGPMADELSGFLDWVKEHDYWNEADVVGFVRAVLDAHLGRPPESFTYDGKSYTPQTFLRDVLRLQMDDYVCVLSTMREPFGKWTKLDVYDNWRQWSDFLNLPLDDFYRVLRSSVQDGYTLAIGGDTSEPGVDGVEGAADVPRWDIPRNLIDQASRELRIDGGSTGDDHGVHCVGYLKHAGREWFLIKDSNRSSRYGQFKGYYFYSGDYIRLKMLSFMVHQDRLKGLLPSEAPQR
jgi:bleomycin hydrolase